MGRAPTCWMLARLSSGCFWFEAASADGIGGPAGSPPTTGGGMLTGAAQPQLIGALHELQLLQHFLPQFQWANQCLHDLHFDLQQAEQAEHEQDSAAQEGAAQEGAGPAQPQTPAPQPHAPPWFP